jgi:hypothetical protein
MTRNCRFIVSHVIPLLVAVAATVSCSDSSGPNGTSNAGRFTIQVRGPANLDLVGHADVYPGLTSGTIENLNLVTTTTNLFYRLEIFFAPPISAPRGSFAVGTTAAVRATFYIFDRTLNDYAQIAPAQSGTLTMEECSLSKCVGTFTGQVLLGSQTQQSTITASFHARLQ